MLEIEDGDIPVDLILWLLILKGVSREQIWKDIDEHLQIIHGNLGVCCQEYCDSATALHSLEEIMDKLAQLREEENK